MGRATPRRFACLADHGGLPRDHNGVVNDNGDDRESRLRVLREALEAGERSGPAVPFDIERWLASKRAVVEPMSPPDDSAL
ncbi:type II toxin-antitoxin system ParD family antitoxin [Nocardia nova]|nr:type II toxin-antitoxin system ParD family antitoxin [Nocardia nova]